MVKYKHRNLEFTKEFIESLPKTIDDKTNCWIYSGYSLRGYGVICIDYQDYPVHRLSCAIYHNKSYKDSSWETRHICNNTKCFNPNHIQPGTHAQNMNDRIKAGTSRKRLICSKCGSLLKLTKTKGGMTPGRTVSQCVNCKNARRRKVG